MNISTGGPHILLFERDQQLATLLTSELQLAGYECHTARTAVEVFDSIARHPIRLVLVNLAQAAASRREFWVALDTQRRGRGVQVFTFHCTNIAAYGPKDPDERVQTVMPDLEFDGMLGLMSLIEAVQARVPGTGVFSNTNTMPRVPKVSASPASQPTIQRTPQTAPLTSSTSSTYSGNTIRATISTDTSASYQTPQRSTTSLPAMPTTGQQSYSEKIRAVLYPNQQGWSSAGITPQPEHRQTYDSRPQTPEAEPPSAESTILQRLANGQSDGGESSLAQLSRMVQQHHANSISSPTQSVNQTTPLPNEERIATQSLRASPIQGLPAERTGGSEAIRRSEWANYGQLPSTPPPLSSITMPPPTRVPLVSEIAVPSSPDPVPGQPGVQRDKRYTMEGKQEQVVIQRAEEPIVDGKEKNSSNQAFVEKAPRDTQDDLHSSIDPDAVTSPNNAMLIDIMQSLPPMPPPPQPPAPQVLNGRATRSLGSVLLAGHLVPESRLEVAQHIQRMLRGVDLNYQLGEILLMFKLLTPDQLLAASLVSYGMITTTQISALGRIRQELHAIGLEYDLENLLILFRILTPEQLREVKSSWQS